MISEDGIVIGCKCFNAPSEKDASGSLLIGNWQGRSDICFAAVQKGLEA
jgi:hypothetical protein